MKLVNFLTIAELEKATPKTCERDFESLPGIVTKFKAMAVVVNEDKRRIEMYQQLFKLGTKIKDCPV